MPKPLPTTMPGFRNDKKERVKLIKKRALELAQKQRKLSREEKKSFE